MGWWPFRERVDPALAQRLAEIPPFSPEPVLAPQPLTSDEIRARKRGGTGGVAKPGDYVPSARMAALVRDAYGKPRFDEDPRSYPAEVQAAWQRMMTPAEIEEYFG